MDLLLAHHVVEYVCINACCIYHKPCLQYSIVRVKLKSAVLQLLNVLHLCVELKLHTIHVGVLRQGNGQSEGAYNSAGRRIEGSHCVFCNIRLHLLELLSAENPKLLHAVGNASLIESLEIRKFLLMHTEYEGTVSSEVEIQILGQLLHHLIAFHIQFGHQRTCGRVIACVDNGAVRLGSAAALIRLLLQYTYLCLIP